MLALTSERVAGWLGASDVIPSSGPVEALWRSIVDHAPALLSAFGLALVMWLVARVLRSLVARVLGMSRLDAATEKTQIGKLLRALDPGMTLSRAIATLVYLGVLLMAFMSAADLLGLTTVREAVGSVLAYVPRLITVIFVLGLGGYIASTARRAAGAVLREMRSPYAASIETITEVALLVITVGIAVDLLGVDVSFLTANLSMIIAVGLVSIAFLFSWSMRRPAEEIIANYYLRRMVAPGDRINLGAIEGTIESFTPIGVLLRDAAGSERFVPARHILDGMACSGRARKVTRAGEGKR